MFYNQILEALRTRFTGVSDNILQKTAARLAKTVTSEDGVKPAVDGVTLQQVIDSYGDSRATEAQQSAVKNYETKYGLKDGKAVQPNNGGGSGEPTDTTTTQPNGGGASETVPAWAQAIIDGHKTITDRLNKMDGERTTASRRQQISTVVSKLPETLRKPYERISLDNLSDDEFNALVTEVTSEVDGIVKETATKGAVFGRPAANAANNPQGELTDEQQKAIAHRDNKPAADGQPF